MNLLRARLEAAQLHVAGIRFAAPASCGPDGDVVLGIRPGALKIAPHGIAARIELIENMGDSAIVDCTIAMCRSSGASTACLVFARAMWFT